MTFIECHSAKHNTEREDIPCPPEEKNYCNVILPPLGPIRVGDTQTAGGRERDNDGEA